MRTKGMVKAKVDMPAIGVSKGETGRIIDEYTEKNSGNKMRAIKFKKGGYGVFGNDAFNNLLSVTK